MDRNSIRVPIIKTVCCNIQFDSTYPIRLNGIIRQSEFQESIKKINRAISSSVAMRLGQVILGLCASVGTILSSIDAQMVTSDNIHRINGRIGSFGGGIGFCAFGLLFFICAFIFHRLRRTVRVQQAIAEESMKYSLRSPTPCSWRLETTRNDIDEYGNSNNNGLPFYLVIDIGRSTVPGSGVFYSNQASNESTYLVGQGDNYTPPLYSHPSTKFCSKCGAQQQDRSARFCSSCGQAF